MTPLRTATLHSLDAGCATFALALGWRCRVMLLPGGIGRFSLLPPEGWREPRTWALDPAGEFPLHGRARETLFTPDASVRVLQLADGVTLEAEQLRARISLQPFGVTWEQRDAAGDWQFCCGDRASYAYAVSPRSGLLHHWQARDAHDQYYGLGDKTGPLDHHGRRLRTRALDALGYDAQTGDPLYKHWPFFLGRRADSGSVYGLYYDTLAECSFDFGCEHDNYHGRYRATEVDDGDLDAYVFAGPDLRAALARFVAAIGGTAMPPRWSLGYANTAMALADHADAQARIRHFLARAEAEAFPLSSFHFGSGYTSRGKQRYVFTWNTRQVPRRAGAAAGLCRCRRAHRGQPEPLPARRPPGLRGAGERRRLRARRAGRPALPRTVLGRLGRAPRLQPRRRHALVAERNCSGRSSTSASTPAGTTTTNTGCGAKAPRCTVSASRCRCTAHARCRRC